MLALLVDVPLGQALGMPDDGTSYFSVAVYLAIPIAIAAAIASRSWRGALALAAGLAVAGGFLGASDALNAGDDVLSAFVGGALVVLFGMGFLGLPVYLIATGLLQLSGRLRGAHPDEPTETSVTP